MTGRRMKVAKGKASLWLFRHKASNLAEDQIQRPITLGKRLDEGFHPDHTPVRSVPVTVCYNGIHHFGCVRAIEHISLRWPTICWLKTTRGLMRESRRRPNPYLLSFSTSVLLRMQGEFPIALEDPQPDTNSKCCQLPIPRALATRTNTRSLPSWRRHDNG